MINIITKLNCKISSIKVQRLIFFLIEKSFLILGTKIEPVLYRNQCEQMARLFDHFWPFMTTKFFSNYNQIAKEVLKFCPIQNKPLNKYQIVAKVVNFRKIWSHLYCNSSFEVKKVYHFFR